MSQPRYPNQQPGSFQPQWGGGASSGGFGHPQQGAWGGQWQQQHPPPPAPHPQQGGFYAPQPPQGGYPHQQFPSTPQLVPGSQPPPAPAQAFAQQQQLLAMQQQRQMAYIQEQQRLAREEQRKREFEIQKRKLQHISVVNPAVPNPLDDLFGKKLPSAAGSRSQGAKPSGSSTPSSNNSTPPPPPSQLPTQTFSSEPPQGVSVPTPQVASQGQPGNAQTDIQKQKKEVQPAKPDAADTYKKLMADSLSNLSGPAPPTRKKMEFKTSSTALKTGPRVEKSFAQSSKSRTWSANTGDFAGVFAVHQPQQQEGQQDDGFGEFHSSADSNFGEFHSSDPSSSTGSLEQNVFQAAPLLQPQQQTGVHLPPPQNQQQGSFVLGQAGVIPSQVPLGLGTVTPTSSYTHPIAATSVSGPVSNTVTCNAPHHLQGIQFRARGDSPASAPLDTTPNVAVPNLPPSSVPKKLESSRFPPVYSEVYKQCCSPCDAFVRTDLLLPILTSSQLPQPVLRDLWTIANKSVPGKLNQTELYVLLGLIGLAQTGHPSPSMDALKSAPYPPVPRFSALPEVSSSSTPGPPPTTGDLQSAGDFGEFHGMAPPTSSLAQPTLPSTHLPSLQPALAPTQTPSLQPALAPTQTPSLQPALTPTQTPSLQPTLTPTQTPSLQPAITPTQTPSLQPALAPTQTPSLQPALTPTQTPSLQPALAPTQTPSLQPALTPTQTPSLQPAPTLQQTAPSEPTSSAVLLPVNPVLPVPKPSPLVPEAVTQANDKYSAFEELRGIGLTSVEPETISNTSGVTMSAPMTQPSGVKYAAFDELRQLSNTNTSLVMPSQGTPSLEAEVIPSTSSSEDPFGPFISIPPPLSSVTTNPQPPPKPSVTTIPQSLQPGSTGAKPTDGRSVSPNAGIAGVGDLSSFTGYNSASSTSTLSTAKATSLPATTTMMSDSVTSTTENLFVPFGSDSQVHSTDKSWADFSNFTTVQTVGPPANAATVPQAEAISEVPYSQTIGGPELSAATVEVTPGEEDRKPRSQSIGLEMLEQELEGDTETVQPPPPVDFSQPLIPETVTHVKGGDEDFGEFEAYGVSTAQTLPLQAKEVERGVPTSVWKPPLKSSQVDPVRILTTCLSKCEEVLEQSAEVFAEVKESSLLQEICEVEEGRNKLRGIVEVYRLAKRVFCSLMHMNQGAASNHQVKNIQKHWKTLTSTLPNNTMEKLYSQTAMAKAEEESDVLSDTISKCSICLLSKDVSVPSPLSLDNQKEEYSLPLLFHQGQSYHPTCANFWYNAVREELPTQ